MSTRRARIKAITSLPVRRKNRPITEVGNVPKSPRTPHSKEADDDEKEKRSPAAVASKPPTPIPKSAELSKSQTEKIQSPVTVPNVTLDTQQRSSITQKTSEKVPVITSASSMFASPLNVRDSPSRRRAPPPLIMHSPKTFHSNREINITPKSTIIQCVSNNDGISKISTHKIVTPTSKKNIIDDYNIPSVPESISFENDGAVMDGIVPLQPARSTPKPISLLKDEIISDNAEVLFDPIIPLPSPSKVRPKLRPVPRLAPLRRNSIQGSASESEDESRRLLATPATPATPAPAPPPRQRHDSHTSLATVHSVPTSTIREVGRIRNDSVCSSASQATIGQALPASPSKDKTSLKQARRQEMMNRRMAAMRRRKETVHREPLTMYDLIFYNPTNNPIIPDQDEVKAKEANAKEAEKEADEVEDDEEEEPAEDSAPVPQIKLGPNGEIVLDEKSLTIKQTQSLRRVSGVVREGAWGGGGGRYSRGRRTADWTDADTVRFYRALAALGTDFTLMQPLFPARTRRDLKIKFKKEERLNGAQVDKALRSATVWDAGRLQAEFSEERAEAERRAVAEKERIAAEKVADKERYRLARELRLRQSKGSKAIESVAPRIMPQRSSAPMPTADAFLRRALESKINRKAKRSTDSPQHSNKDQNNQNHIKFLTPSKTPDALSAVPANIESGSLVVLTVNDPASPTKKMLQTYIAHGGGKLTPVEMPSSFLSSVVGYMKKGGKPGCSTASSPSLASPSSVASQDSSATSRTNTSVIKVNPSPAKRRRMSSFSITPL